MQGGTTQDGGGEGKSTPHGRSAQWGGAPPSAIEPPPDVLVDDAQSSHDDGSTVGASSSSQSLPHSDGQGHIGVSPPNPLMRKSCDLCYESRLKCVMTASGKCEQCIIRGFKCVMRPAKKRGRPPLDEATIADRAERRAMGLLPRVGQKLPRADTSGYALAPTMPYLTMPAYPGGYMAPMVPQQGTGMGTMGGCGLLPYGAQGCNQPMGHAAGAALQASPEGALVSLPSAGAAQQAPGYAPAGPGAAGPCAPVQMQSVTVTNADHQTMQYCPPPPRAPHPYLATSDPLLPPTPHFSAGIGAPPQPIMHHPPAGPQAHISNHHAAYACGQLPYPAAHQLPLQATPPAQDRLIAELALAKEQIARQQGLLDLHRIVDGGRPSAEARPPKGTEAAAAASALTAIRTAATPSSHIQPPHAWPNPPPPLHAQPPHAWPNPPLPPHGQPYQTWPIPPPSSHTQPSYAKHSGPL